jgi:hypothetical protein
VEVTCLAKEAVGTLHVTETKFEPGERGEGGAGAIVEDPDAQVDVVKLRDGGVGIFEDLEPFVAAGKEDVSAGSESGGERTKEW